MPQDFSFHHACERGDKAVVMKMLKKNGKDILKQPGLEYGQSPLHVCCEAGREDLVQLFLQDRYSGKIEINAVDKNGWTPLHSACKKGNLDIIELLLKKGAYQRAITNEGASPLHYFVRNDDQGDPLKHNRVMKLFLEGAFIDSENKHGETPLHQAAMKDRFQNVSFLVNAKADPNKQTRHGETPLHFAARGNSHVSTTMLLRASADPTIEADDGVNVYSIAKKWEPSQIKQILYDWYEEKKKPMPQEMKDDFDIDDSESSEKKTRKRKKNRSASGNGRSPKSDKKGKGKDKDMGRVSSLRTMEANTAPRRTTTDPKESVSVSNVEIRTTSGSSIRAERRRSNSINDLNPSQEGEMANINQRLELLNQRAADRDNSKRNGSEPVVQSKRVNDLVSNFEQLTSAKIAEIEGPSIDRLRRFKHQASSVVDVEAIEEKVSGGATTQQKEENSLMATLKDISSKKLSLDAINDPKLINSLKNGWKCKVCKNIHKDIPLFFFCAAPQDYENLDGTEKANRAKLSADLCSIEKTSKFYIRALLELPFRQEVAPSGRGKGSKLGRTDSGHQIVVTWGLWVAVSRTDFDKVVDTWNSNDSFSIEGILNNNLPVYNNCLGTPVTVTTRPGGFRPLISINSGDNALATETAAGINIERLGSIVEFVFHTAKS
mmetsp:Transcript_70387/g.106463  ORF Transcript_70387/g.106463 Transcript_70387/m.106463 type:complete len:662 (+) Transcript_70387:33-2018(+)|eukprot:CAMPEP_0117023848 /NCGR_PEP_ID=MMETSP0472-20121206/17764_1 /TAXON_ID=693140 ORGANISM="Tiarina fusus, Strain LIS" /NCGR_SAMPLE_ID=MMETSP0472 /ASSEMBLY_ACC=CAM_ASM_000603 /LENGTH=661 /DNA_ID=CAMNT_0004730099 /DNA_START=33 /DNA_END=2018 /DNA_ORIENTATION=-